MLGLYLRLIWSRERASMQYRLSFALASLGTAIYIFTEVTSIAVFFQHVPTIGGWSFAEVAFLYGFASTGFSIGELFATGFDELPRHVRLGTFDRVMVRPHGAFFQTLAIGLNLRRLSRVLPSIGILAIGLGGTGTTMTPDKWAVLLTGVAASIAIYFAIFVAGGAWAFWTVQGNEAVNVFTNGGQFITSYPLDAYGGWMRRTLTFVVPLAFASYYPALYVLDRPPPLGLPDWVRLIAPLVALLFVAFASWIWSVGVRRYLSTGS